jgi:hypothetical protein
MNGKKGRLNKEYRKENYGKLNENNLSICRTSTVQRDAGPANQHYIAREFLHGFSAREAVVPAESP